MRKLLLVLVLVSLVFGRSSLADLSDECTIWNIQYRSGARVELRTKTTWRMKFDGADLLLRNASGRNVGRFNDVRAVEGPAQSRPC